jgi:DNA-binding transcriptional MerR regulator
MTYLTRGKLAHRAGINRETVRFYERSGLLPVSARSHGNYCLFDEEAAERLLFIKRAQTAGFALEDIRLLLAIRFDADSTCGDVRAVVDAKIEAIDQKVRQLEQMRETLLALRDDCPGGDRPLDECPILESFASVEGHI